MEVLAWGKPTIRMAKTPSDEAMAADDTLKSVGTIKEDTTNVTPQDGTSKEMYGEGHELVGAKELEGYDQITFDVIAMDLEDLSEFFGETVTSGKFTKKTTIVKDSYSIEIDPEAVGATGYRAPKCNVKIQSIFTAGEGWLHRFTLKGMKAATGIFSEFYTKEAPTP